MKKKSKVISSILLLLLILLTSSKTGVVNSLTTKEVEASVTYDSEMKTQIYDTYIQLNENGSYQIEERILVDFMIPKHGIYRYIPKKGVSIYYDEKGDLQKNPYYAHIDLVDSNTEVYEDEENGNVVYRFGSEGDIVRQGDYRFSYRIDPILDKEEFPYTYYNIFPTNWGNPIPIGSTFRIEFPKGYDKEKIRFYYGQFAEVKEGEKVLDLTYEDNAITGTLKESLRLGEGITLFSPMGEGYFSKMPTLNSTKVFLSLLSVIFLGVVALLFFFFGKDVTLYPSVQFYPPEGFDSAMTGFMVNGVADNEDILSLIVYWADKGYLYIEDEGRDKIKLRMIKPLPEGSPYYQTKVFDNLFKGKRKTSGVKITNLKYKFYDTLVAAKKLLKMHMVSEVCPIYTRSSKVARVIATLLSILPMALTVLIISIYCDMNTMSVILSFLCVIGLGGSVILFNYSMDQKYKHTARKHEISLVIQGVFLLTVLGFYVGNHAYRASKGLVFDFTKVLFIVCVCTVIMAFLTAIMKKRTKLSREYIERIIGLKDFIEQAELDRLKELTLENPSYFYNILPYAYVLGLTDIFMDQFEGIMLPQPDWYHTTYQYDVFDMVFFRNRFLYSMNNMKENLTIPKPPSSDSSSGSFFSGGSSDGGGFSGGGFGGGGGGSW